MIVDDSMVARAVLSQIVESDSEFESAAVAGTAEDAIDALQAVRVDTILLDLEMPGAGGLRLIPDIIKAADGARDPAAALRARRVPRVGAVYRGEDQQKSGAAQQGQHPDQHKTQRQANRRGTNTSQSWHGRRANRFAGCRL